MRLKSRLSDDPRLSGRNLSWLTELAIFLYRNLRPGIAQLAAIVTILAAESIRYFPFSARIPVFDIVNSDAIVPLILAMFFTSPRRKREQRAGGLVGAFVAAFILGAESGVQILMMRGNGDFVAKGLGTLLLLAVGTLLASLSLVVGFVIGYGHKDRNVVN